MERHIISVFFLLIPLILLLPQKNFKISNALIIQLVHPNSLNSHFSIKNLTRQQRINHLIRDSINRAHSRSSTRTSYSNNNFSCLELTTIQREIRVKENSIVLLKVGVGTFKNPISYKTYYLHMDTGSDLIWLQCQDCLKPRKKCFGKPPIFFPNIHSSSYNPIPCNTHELCYKDICVDGFCAYGVRYGDASKATGTLATEKFTFDTVLREDDITNVFDLVFGCNNFYDGLSTNQGDIGVLGLGWGSRSLMNQITPTGIHNSFAYCFSHYDSSDLGSLGYLTLGSDGYSQDDFSFTALLHYGNDPHYYLNLEGISVGQRKLTIDKKVFVRQAKGKGGTIIDSGTSYTYLNPQAYKKLRRVLKRYIKSLGRYWPFKPDRDKFELDLCYTGLKGTLNEFPSITFHFSGGNLILKSENVFIKTNDPPDGFCLAMLPDDNGLTVLGAYQQSNFRFIYDRSRYLLLFKPEDCNEGA
ncbi:hypothetical protein RND81_14G013500 [Saponaria officinalis]|uniref:Peptidase A1 domain-containing protein n=1 Tax=Saponaria officinalis TaxID=3572 RepID=A0AAW1GHW9_SAPOF